MADDPNPEHAPKPRLSRRQALARLGLAAGAAYAAPTVIGLNRAAAGHGGGDDGPPWGRGRSGKSKHKSSKGKGRD